MERNTRSLNELEQSEELSNNDILEIMNGPDDGRIYEIKKDQITIGRNNDRDFIISYEQSVSRIHAEIHIHNKKYYILDCESLNGTWIDDKQIEPKKETLLMPNQIFSLGDVKLRLRSKDKD